MKIRRDAVFISSVFLTIAFLCLLPPFFKGALSRYDAAGRAQLETGWRLYSEMWASFDIASSAIVLVGLIVTWGGYIKTQRWTWAVMFVIVWGWFFPAVAFPDFVYPLYRGAINRSDLTGLLLHPMAGPAIGLEMTIFVLMVLALVLPFKAFFWGRRNTAAASPTSSGRQ